MLLKFVRIIEKMYFCTGNPLLTTAYVQENYRKATIVEGPRGKKAYDSSWGKTGGKDLADERVR